MQRQFGVQFVIRIDVRIFGSLRQQGCITDDPYFVCDGFMILFFLRIETHFGGFLDLGDNCKVGVFAFRIAVDPDIPGAELVFGSVQDGLDVFRQEQLDDSLAPLQCIAHSVSGALHLQDLISRQFCIHRKDKFPADRLSQGGFDPRILYVAADHRAGHRFRVVVSEIRIQVNGFLLVGHQLAEYFIHFRICRSGSHQFCDFFPDLVRRHDTAQLHLDGAVLTADLLRCALESFNPFLKDFAVFADGGFLLLFCTAVDAQQRNQDGIQGRIFSFARQFRNDHGKVFRNLENLARQEICPEVQGIITAVQLCFVELPDFFPLLVVFRLLEHNVPSVPGRVAQDRVFRVLDGAEQRIVLRVRVCVNRQTAFFSVSVMLHLAFQFGRQRKVCCVCGCSRNGQDKAQDHRQNSFHGFSVSSGFSVI